ncbi:MAG: hypothetical protein V5A24_00800 [Haloarculaceae archaeon]
MIAAPLTIGAGALDAGAEEGPQNPVDGPTDREITARNSTADRSLAARTVPPAGGPTSLDDPAQSATDGPTCGKAPGSVSGEAIPDWVEIVCTASSNESSTFRIKMRGAWVYVVKIQAPPDASATQVVNGTRQTLFRYGLPETKLGVWPPVLQLFGKQPGEVTIIMNGGSALDTLAGSLIEAGVWQTIRGQQEVELNPVSTRCEWSRSSR